MTPEPFEFSPASTPLGLPFRASAILDLWTAAGQCVVIQNADSGAFTTATGLSLNRSRRLLGLSQDGTFVLMRDVSETDEVRIGGYHLPTARVRWTAIHSSFVGLDAAASPDGRTVAFLRRGPTDDLEKVEPDTISVCHADLMTGTVRSLRSTPGLHTADTSIGYSRDGRRIVATYDEPAPDQLSNPSPHTIVMDLHTGSVDRLPNTVLAPKGDESWISNTVITCDVRDAPSTTRRIQTIDLETGQRRPLLPAALRPVGRVGDRLLIYPNAASADGLQLDTVTAGGDDRQPFLTISEPCAVHSVHFAH